MLAAAAAARERRNRMVEGIGSKASIKQGRPSAASVTGAMVLHWSFTGQPAPACLLRQRAVLAARNVTRDGVRLARPRLAVHKDGRIEAFGNWGMAE